MRVLFVVHQFLPRHAAGTEIYTFHLAKELQRRGHDVHLFCTEIHPDRPQYELARREFEGLPIFEAVHNHAFASFRDSYLDSAMEGVFRRVLDEVEPDLVHCQHLHLHSIGYIDIAKDRGLPVAYTLHEYMLMCLRGGQLVKPGLVLCDGPSPEGCADCATIYPPPGQSRSWLPKGLRRLFGGNRHDGYVGGVKLRRAEIQRRLDRVDLFISPSAFLRDRFIQEDMIDPGRILHSDNGFEVAPFADVERTTSDVLRVGYVGTIAPYKGVHLLVEAFQGIDDDGIECRIYGDVQTFPDYAKELDALPTPPSVRYMGRFDNTRIATVLGGLDVLVVPSLWFENSPLTIHEAYLAGVPVIAADRGGMAELVEDGVTGLHFKLGDAADLRAKIRRLRTEPGLLQQLGSRFPHVKDIAEDTTLMEARYSDLVAGRTPSN